MKTYQLIVIHATATREGVDIGPDWIHRVHRGPKDLPGGRVKWMGREYPSRRDLPDIDFHGRPLRAIAGNGWKQVGYYGLWDLQGKFHHLVDNNLDRYVDPWEITNGARGYNDRALHLVYVGGLDKHGRPKDTRTPTQQLAMVNELTYLKEKLPGVRILGHRDLPGVHKACPCFDAKTEYAFL
ncbi:MAG: lysozyme [Bacteroidota bacterium]|nr:lysozyme [Bacteroidota bacterium]MDX5448335.1 lysozyme [Bacteroidota bacterium]